MWCNKEKICNDRQATLNDPWLLCSIGCYPPGATHKTLKLVLQGEMQPQIYKQIRQIYAAIKFAMETAAEIQWSDW